MTETPDLAPQTETAMTNQTILTDGDIGGTSADRPALICVGNAYDALSGALVNAGFDTARFEASAVQSLAERHKGASKGAIGIVWSSPEDIAEQALLNGRDPTPELKQWCSDAAEVLRFFRKYRRQMLLIEAPCFTDPNAADEHFVIKQRFHTHGLALPIASPPGMTEDDAEASVDGAGEREGIKRLARMVLLHDQELQALLAELCASSISPVERDDDFSTGTAGVFSLLANWKSGERQAADLAPALDTMSKERGLLRDQVVLQTDELARSSAECEKLGALLDEQRKQAADLEEERNALRQQLQDEAIARKEEFAAELTKKQLLLDEHEARIAELEAHSAEQKSEIDRQTAHGIEIMSRSADQQREIEKQAAVIDRQMAQIADYASAVASLSDERELLREQVVLQTEESARRISQHNALASQVAELEARIADQQREIEKQAAVIDGQRAQIADHASASESFAQERALLRKQVALQAEELARTASECDRLGALLGKQEKHAADLEYERNALRQQLQNEAIARKEEFESELSNKQLLVDQQKTQIAEQAATIAALTSEVELLRRQVILQSEQNASAKERFDETQREFHAIGRKLKQKERLLAGLEQGRALFQQQLAPEAGPDASWELLLDHVSRKGAPFWDLIDLVTLGPGVQRAEGVIWTSRESARSHAIYGPYLKLEPGEYEVCFAMSMKPIGLKRPVAVVELASNVDDVILSRRTEGEKIFSNHFMMKDNFTVSKDSSKNDAHEFEVRLWTDQMEKCEIYLAYIRKIA